MSHVVTKYTFYSKRVELSFFYYFAILKYFKYIQVRVPFSTALKKCQQIKIIKANGWSQLHEILEGESKKGAAETIEINNVLEEIFLDSIYTANRAVRIYPVLDENFEEVFDVLDSINIESSVYSRSFPMPVDDVDISNMGDDSFLVEKKENEDGSISLLFTSRKEVIEKDIVEHTSYNNEKIVDLGWDEYDEFILVKKKYIQVYEHVLYSRVNKEIQIRVENYSGVNLQKSFNQILSKVNNLLKKSKKTIFDTINFFPAIKNLYLRKDEGKVVELGFTTETGSAKLEKMRRGGKDLRNEAFHVGGKKAVQDVLAPYRLTVRWFDEKGSSLEEVLLPGSIRQLGNTRPFLDYVVISDAPCSLSFNKAVRRVLEYLP